MILPTEFQIRALVFGSHKLTHWLYAYARPAYRSFAWPKKNDVDWENLFVKNYKLPTPNYVYIWYDPMKLVRSKNIFFFFLPEISREIRVKHLPRDLHVWCIFQTSLKFIPVWLQPCDDCYEHIFFHKFCGYFLSQKFLFWAISLHSQPSWAFISNSPSQEQVSSFSTGSLFALGSCLLLSRLVTTCSNSMKKPTRIPHTTPWKKSSEGVIFVEDREDWRNVLFFLYVLENDLLWLVVSIRNAVTSPQGFSSMSKMSLNINRK